MKPLSGLRIMALVGALLGPGLVLTLLHPTTAAPALPDIEPRVDPATHKSYTETIPDSKVQFDMVAIPGGVFLQGSPGVEKDAGSDEQPRHPVRFSSGETPIPEQVPALGEHTDEILAELGRSEEQIAALRAEGAVA